MAQLGCAIKLGNYPLRNDSCERENRMDRTADPGAVRTGFVHIGLNPTEAENLPYCTKLLWAAPMLQVPLGIPGTKDVKASNGSAILQRSSRSSY
jgi:hypothetical protein